MSQPLRQVLPRHRRAFGHGAMTAALVIVPVHSARARNPLPGEEIAASGAGPRVAGGIHTVPGELPWMVRLSTGAGATTGTDQQSLTAGPWVDSAGITRSRPASLSAVPAYRRGSYTF
jgi:hypothetical protein